jgi:hypothetical protein
MLHVSLSVVGVRCTVLRVEGLPLLPHFLTSSIISCELIWLLALLHFHLFLSLLHIGVGIVGMWMVNKPLFLLLFLTSHSTFHQLSWLLDWLHFPLILCLIVFVALLLLHL